MPIFSCWTLGPVRTNSRIYVGGCTLKKKENSNSKVGVSFFYTFFNIMITFCGSLCCYFTIFINYGYLRIDKCIEIGSFYGDCTIFAHGLSIIFPLFILSFFIILFLKLKSEMKICNVPLTNVDNFEISELQPKSNHPMKKIHSIISIPKEISFRTSEDKIAFLIWLWKRQICNSDLIWKWYSNKNTICPFISLWFKYCAIYYFYKCQE